MTAPEQKEQKKRLLKAKIAVALQDETGQVPSKEKIEEVFLLTRVMYKAVLGLHFKRKEQKKQGLSLACKLQGLCYSTKSCSVIGVSPVPASRIV